MIDAELIAGELEAEGFPRNHRIVSFTTTGGNQAMALVTVTVTAPAVQAEDDLFNIPFSSAADVVPLDVLTNDLDPITGDNSTLHVGSVTQPPAGQGSVAISADGRSVEWSRPAGFVGQVQFDYTAERA